MKKLLLSLGALLFVCAIVSAQSTVDSIAAKYKLQAMPEPLTMEKTFPVIGTYQLNDETTTGNLTISLDPANKGMIWVEGLPQGKFKAYLRQSPATYRILPQKTEGGTEVPEGTLYFDPSTNTLQIALGKAYEEADPTGIFTLHNNLAASEQNEAKMKTDDGTKIKTEKEGNKLKVKAKTPAGKEKAKVTFYTATKLGQSPTATNTQQ